MPEQRQSRDIEQPQRMERERNRPSEQSRGGTGTGMARRSPSSLGLLRMDDPFSMMNALRRDIDRIFETSFFGDIDRSLWSPQVEVREKDGKLHVSADLPGLSKNDVHIDVQDNMLTIEGERRSERSDERAGWSERSYGRFSRTIPLPEGINPDSANAKFENGVLEIAFDAPRREQPRSKKIEIR